MAASWLLSERGRESHRSSVPVSSSGNDERPPLPFIYLTKELSAPKEITLCLHFLGFKVLCTHNQHR